MITSQNNLGNFNIRKVRFFFKNFYIRNAYTKYILVLSIIYLVLIKNAGDISGQEMNLPRFKAVCYVHSTRVTSNCKWAAFFYPLSLIKWNNYSLGCKHWVSLGEEGRYDSLCCLIPPWALQVVPTYDSQLFRKKKSNDNLKRKQPVSTSIVNFVRTYKMLFITLHYRQSSLGELFTLSHKL